MTKEAWAAYMRAWNSAHPGYATKYKRAWAEKNKERRLAQAAAWRHRNGEKRKAHHKVYRAVRAGVLIRPAACSNCEKEGAVEASHDDYSKPLEVIWLCRRCHARKDMAK